ncbi:hypothetical protein FUAX_29430 [Fulvitalea axinellae]|uniref:SusD-like N-terminal domain-containing protein n=1 Tax=Fulvitalea axinellae TaxID=1182444 RepID=A0AAU9DBM6_9BACT|nr:hypothetical protein FUAX_29430 [Fulvitalea axinellae]
MKNFKHIIAGFALLGLGACSDFLDEVPDNRVEIDNVDKVGQLVTNAYNTSAYLFTDWMSDNAAPVEGIIPLRIAIDAYKWEPVDGTNQDTPEYFWSGAYQAISHANEAIYRLNELPNTLENVEKKGAYRGEALLSRAYHHFTLVSLFSKVYNEATASTDLGIPYVDEPERQLVKTYKRGTVQEVYDKIEKDMLEGIDLLNEEFYSGAGKYHFSKEAAYAFASRFYLFKKDYANTVKYADMVLKADPSDKIRDMIHLMDVQNGNLERLFNSPDEEANLLLVHKYTIMQRSSRQGYGLSASLDRRIFAGGSPTGGSDIRGEYRYSLNSGAGIRYPKFDEVFEKENLASETGLPAVTQTVLKGEEALFNRMEATWHLYLASGATKADRDKNLLNRIFSDFNAYIPRRYTGAGTMNEAWLDTEAEELAIRILTAEEYNKLTDEQKAQTKETYEPIVLIGDILNEKRKEFVHEGMRWWDIIRNDIQVTHVDQAGTVYELPADDPKRVIQIPESALDFGLMPNPR